jgi:hypothetical protein
VQEIESLVDTIIGSGINGWKLVEYTGTRNATHVYYVDWYVLFAIEKKMINRKLIAKYNVLVYFLYGSNVV